MIKYYKSHVYCSLIGWKPVCTDYYKVKINSNNRISHVSRFRVSLHRTQGMESQSLDDLSSESQTSWSIRHFRKYESAVPCSEAEYRKNFFKIKRKLIAKAKRLKP